MKILAPILAAGIGAVLMSGCRPSVHSVSRVGCMERAHSLGIGLMLYTQAHSLRLPTARDPAGLKQALAPYVKDPNSFSCAVTGEPFAWNAALAGRSLAPIERPADTVAIYDPTPHDGKRVVGYLDSHVKAIPETQFAAMWAGGRLK